MRNKTFLPMMEQMCVILFFSIVAAICLQGFSTAHHISRTQQEKDQAVVAVQNAAEVMKHTQGNLEEAARLLGGNCDGAVVTVRLNAQWQVTTGDDGVYLLRIDPAASGESLLGRAQVVLLAGEKVIFSLNVSWQEVR